LRVTPTDQLHWHTRLESQMENMDIFGNRFFTIGAGPGDSDTGACSGFLISGLNRTRDVSAVPWWFLRLQYSPFLENSLIERLLNAQALFPGGQLQYECFPDDNPAAYNSNSFARGLLDATDIPAPAFPHLFPSMFPGFGKPVPREYFVPKPPEE